MNYIQESNYRKRSIKRQQTWQRKKLDVLGGVQSESSSSSSSFVEDLTVINNNHNLNENENDAYFFEEEQQQELHGEARDDGKARNLELKEAIQNLIPLNNPSFDINAVGIGMLKKQMFIATRKLLKEETTSFMTEFREELNGILNRNNITST